MSKSHDHAHSVMCCAFDMVLLPPCDRWVFCLLLRLGGIFETPPSSYIAGTVLCIATLGVFVTAIVLANNDRCSEARAERESIDEPPDHSFAIDDTTKTQAEECEEGQLEDTSRQSRSGTAGSAVGTGLIGANKARRKFLGLLKSRSSGGTGIQPTDDDNVELSAVHPPSASTTTSSDDDSGINLSDNHAASTTSPDVSNDDCTALSAADAAAKSTFIEGSGEKHGGEELTVHSMANPMHHDSVGI